MMPPPPGFSSHPIPALMSKLLNLGDTPHSVIERCFDPPDPPLEGILPLEFLLGYATQPPLGEF